MIFLTLYVGGGGEIFYIYYSVWVKNRDSVCRLEKLRNNIFNSVCRVDKRDMIFLIVYIYMAENRDMIRIRPGRGVMNKKQSGSSEI